MNMKRSGVMAMSLVSACLATILILDYAVAGTNSSVRLVDSGQSLGMIYSFGVDTGDVDGDGDIDAFVANRYAPNIVWLNDGTGLFTDSGQILGGQSYSFGIALGDLDGDNDLDAFVVNSVNTSDRVWINDGSGTFTMASQNFGNSYSSDVALGDLDGDMDLDAVVALRTNASGFQPVPNRVWINDSNATFTDSGQLLGNGLSEAVTLGDLDSDMDLDFIVANFGANTVWLNQGDGTFVYSGQALGNSNSKDIALGDLDGDSDLDAFVANASLANRIWINDGTGVFTDSGQTLGTFESHAVALGDVDDDGDLDAFVANFWQIGLPTNDPVPNNIWLNDGNAQFTLDSATYGNLHSSDVVLADLNGNQLLDAFVTNRGDRASNFGEPNKVYLQLYKIYMPLIVGD